MENEPSLNPALWVTAGLSQVIRERAEVPGERGAE